MKIATIIHAPFETPGVIEDWALENNHHFKQFHPYAGEELPKVEEFDFLILMGGPQSPLALEDFPYLKSEINLAQQAIDQDKLVIGFCLGAQIIAEALGARTQRSPEKEVGVFPIVLRNEGKQDPLFKDFPDTFPVIHWHNDMPGIAQGARLLASSTGCPQQAFGYGDRVYGFQFHMEITRDIAEELIKHCSGDLANSRFTQTADEIRANDYASINQRMKLILDRLYQKVGSLEQAC